MNFLNVKTELKTVLVTSMGLSVSLTSINEILQTCVLIVTFIAGCFGLYVSFKKHFKKDEKI